MSKMSIYPALIVLLNCRDVRNSQTQMFTWFYRSLSSVYLESATGDHVDLEFGREQDIE